MHGARLKGKVQLIIVNELIESRDNSDAAIFVSDLFNDIHVFIYCFGIDEFPIACMGDNKCIIPYIGGGPFKLYHFVMIQSNVLPPI